MVGGVLPGYPGGWCTTRVSWWVYTSLHTLGGTLVAILSPGIYHPSHLPGTPRSHPTVHSCWLPAHRWPVVERRGPGLNEGGFPWVRASFRC